jgi:hypothetical protein
MIKTRDELQKEHEADLASALELLVGRGPESDWALVRALVHKAVHLTAERKAGEFCALATLLAEMTTHAHEVMHPHNRAVGHQESHSH